MHELTAYFITTDRRDAPEALASLRAQGIPRPVEIVRNVRPLAAAYRSTLTCETPFCLLLDDDTVLHPGVVPRLLDRFRQMRSSEPLGFKMSARVYCEAKMIFEKGGLKFLYTPLLKRVGWPDAPHVAVAQDVVARKMGFAALTCDIEAGVQKRGSDLDVYKKYLWIQIRAQAGQLRQPPSLPMMTERARAGPPWLWFAVLGIVDGMQAGEVSTSKDEEYMGPIGRTLDFAAVTAEDVASIVAQRGLLGAMAQPQRSRGAGAGRASRPSAPPAGTSRGTRR